MTGLPNTGAPTKELLHLVIVLLGTGLILYRVRFDAGRSVPPAKNGLIEHWPPRADAAH